MKRIFIFLLTATASLSVFAQAQNTVKWNLSALLMRNLSFQYERTLSEKTSVLCQVGFMLPRSLPTSRLNDTASGRGSNGQMFEATEVRFKGGFQITPEFRFYPGAEANKGFYIGAYVRYASYGLHMSANYWKDWSSPMRTYDFTGKFSLLHVGGIIGYQWQLGEKATIDWWIAGLQFGSSKVSMKATGDFSDLNQDEFMNDINTNMEGLPIKNLEASLSNSQASVKFGLPGIGFRSGLCFGFRF